MDAHDERIDPEIAQALAQAVDQVEPPHSLRNRVLRSVGGAAAPAEGVRSARGASWWLATAAALTIAAGLAVYAAQLRTRVVRLQGEVRDASASLAVLTAPDLARVDLAGQPIAPRASARVFWSRSRGFVITAANLPALPAGRTYQLWVVTAQAPISVSLVKPDANGRVDVFIDQPLDPAAPVALAVTIEPEGGVPAPTGDKYLVGVL